MQVDTTLGDLIAALTEVSSQFTSDEDEASILVAYLLSDLLRKSDASASAWR